MSEAGTETPQPRARLADRIVTNLPIALALAVALGLRLGLVQTLNVSSLNMAPTLSVDDRVVVRRFGPLAARADVVVYRSPFDPDDLHVGRIVAVDGEQVEMNGSGLLLNERAVLATPAYSAAGGPCAGACQDKSCDGKSIGGNNGLLAAETVGDHCYFTRVAGGLASLMFAPTTVPEGHVFVLSDNRVDERDSRIYGSIPRTAIVGVASFVYYAFDETGIRWDRMTRRVS